MGKGKATPSSGRRGEARPHLVRARRRHADVGGLWLAASCQKTKMPQAEGARGLKTGTPRMTKTAAGKHDVLWTDRSTGSSTRRAAGESAAAAQRRDIARVRTLQQMADRAAGAGARPPKARPPAAAAWQRPLAGGGVWTLGRRRQEGLKGGRTERKPVKTRIGSVTSTKMDKPSPSKSSVVSSIRPTADVTRSVKLHALREHRLVWTWYAAETGRMSATAGSAMVQAREKRPLPTG